MIPLWAWFELLTVIPTVALEALNPKLNYFRIHSLSLLIHFWVGAPVPEVRIPIMCYVQRLTWIITAIIGISGCHECIINGPHVERMFQKQRITGWETLKGHLFNDINKEVHKFLYVVYVYLSLKYFGCRKIIRCNAKYLNLTIIYCEILFPVFK